MTKKERALLNSARLYNFFALFFAVMGLFVFILIYLNNIEGRLMEALSEPFTVLLILFPFAPAVALSLLAKSNEKKYYSLRDSSLKK